MKALRERSSRFLFSTCVCAVLFSLPAQRCAPSRYVKPLARSEQVISASLGGPLIRFSGLPVPIPFTSLGYARGLSEGITGYGHLHTTSLLFGNAQADLGGTFLLYKNEKHFGLTASPALQLAYNLRNQTGFRLWPSADLNAYFSPGAKPSYLYAGLNCWVEPSRRRAHDEPRPNLLLPNLHLGYTVVRTRWQHQFEAKYLGLGLPNQPGVVDYIGLSGKGSFGIYYALIRKF
jgi:hypothetical protein